MQDWKNTNYGAVDDYLATYENKRDKAAKPFEKKTFDLKKYFSVFLDKKEKSAIKTFRVLPNQDDPSTWYKEVQFHSIKVGEEWKKLYDPAQEGNESPLNDARDELRTSSDPEIRKSSSKYYPKTFYIVRGIERSKEADGVKFWRFQFVKDGSGIMDKIDALLKVYKEKAGKGVLWHPYEGRDLIISLAKDEQRGHTKVVSISADDVAPISSDENLMTEWLNDATTWSDVYKKHPVEYLRIVAEGGEPIWDKETKGFVAKSDENNGGGVISAPVVPVQELATTAVAAAEETSTISMDDLPF